MAAALQHSGTSFTLNQPVTGGQHSYTATEFVRLAPGFRYQPLTSTDYFMAKIGESLVVEPPAEGTTGGPGGAGGIVGNDGIVGGTKGMFTVSETGAAIYQIPLEFPGGRAGMTPDLSLVYNSTGTDGIMGPGWSLGGLSVISCVPATRFHDGIKKAAYGHDYEEDTYTLDGQRLIEVVINDFGNYREYRTENDVYSKIMRRPIGVQKDETGKYFEVKTKSGLTYFYGTTIDSRHDFVRNNGYDTYTVSYYISRIQDGFGNRIEFEYFNHADAGEILLKSISYTMNATQTTPTYVISFNYKDRQDILTHYLSYFDNEQIYALKSTTSKLLDYINCTYYSTSQLVKKYSLIYEPKGPGSNIEEKKQYLSAVQEYGLNESVKYNKTVFEWTDFLLPAYSYETISMPLSVFRNSTVESPNGTPGCPPGYISYKATTSNLKYFFNHAINTEEKIKIIRVYDLEQDSYEDYGNDCKYKYKKRISTIFELLQLSASGGYVVAEWKEFLHEEYSYYSTTPIPGNIPVNGLFQGDYNGDSYIDFLFVVYTNDSKIGESKEGLSAIHTSFYLFENDHNETFIGFANPSMFLFSEDEEIALPGDFNGDGITDLASFNTTSKNIQFRLGKKSNPLRTNVDGPITYSIEQSNNVTFNTYLGVNDFNGDGRAELYRRETNNSIIIYYLEPSVNNDLEVVAKNLNSNYRNSLRICSLNPDRKSDFIEVVQSSASIIPHFINVTVDVNSMFGNGSNVINAPISPINFATLYELPSGVTLEQTEVQSTIEPIVLMENAQSQFLLKSKIHVSGFNGAQEYHYFTTLWHCLLPDASGEKLILCDIGNSMNHDDLKMFDFNFDNKTDFYHVESEDDNSDVISIYKSATPNISIKKITTGLGLQTEIYYGNTGNPVIYEGAASASYPVIPYDAPRTVVHEVKRSNGNGGWMVEKYKYFKARAHTEGLGFIGYEKITKTDVTRGFEHSTEYGFDEQFFVSYPSVQTTKLINGTLINQTHTSYLVRQTTSPVDPQKKYYFLQPSSSITTLYELNEAGTSSYAYKKETVSYSPFSIFGDPETITETSETIGGSNPSIITKTTVNQYKAADTEKWILGRLENASTTFTSNNNTAITKKVGFTYYDAPSEKKYGMLRQEITEPDDAALKTTKEYIYDEYGNITTTILSAQGLTSRENKTEYEPSGRFIEYLVNAKAHKTKRSYEAVLGTLTHQEDTDNELVTSFTYNAFGQLEKTIAPDNTQFVSVARWVLQDDNQAPLYAVYYIWSRSSGQSPKKVYYNCLGQELRTVTTGFDGNAVYTDTQYDAKGRVWKKSEPYLPGGTVYYSSIEYDAAGRIKTTTAPDHGGNAVTSFKYLGLTTTITNPNGHTTSTIVNAAGWVVQTNDELGGIVTNHYYSDGGKAWSQVNNDARTKKSYLYDKAGRLKEYHDLSQAPNKIYYTYNAYGEPATEINNAGQLTSYDVYDELGRLKQKTTPDGTVTYGYDAQKKGLPDYMQVGSSHKIEYTYDQYARPIKTIETIEGQIFETGQSYDALGRAAVLTYPSGYAVRHHYTSNGFTEKITEEGSNKQLWKAGAMNARNQYTALNYGSYISQSMTYYEQDGKLKQQSVANKQLNDYNWDKLGNLTYRKTRLGKTEGFSYDAMNRIRYVYHNGQLNFTYNYDALGNLTFKTGVGNYSYEDIADPYKLTAIDNKPATIHNERQEISYNWFNKVKTITERDPQSMAVVRQMELWYGVGMQRVKQVMQNTGQPSETTWYVGGMYEKTEKNGQTTLTHYVDAPSGLVAVVKQTGNNRVINYVLTDHQGSVQLVLSEAGVILEENSYDVWGLRRDPVTYNVYAVMPATQLTHGYTGHEHLDLFMLVNMNGRVYDPVLGRFLSPDPVLQFPNYTQGHNPYAYVLNNPLRYTDPSGYTLVGQLVATSLSMFASAIPGVNLFVPYPPRQPHILPDRLPVYFCLKKSDEESG